MLLQKEYTFSPAFYTFGHFRNLSDELGQWEMFVAYRRMSLWTSLQKKSEVVMALSHYSSVALPAPLMILEVLLKLTNTTASY